MLVGWKAHLYRSIRTIHSPRRWSIDKNRAARYRVGTGERVCSYGKEADLACQIACGEGMDNLCH